VTGSPTITESHLTEVSGLPVHRSLPQRGRRMVGAWCFLDRFGPTEVSVDRTMMVGPHPHIGLHTVTWLLEGEVLHSDSLGNEQIIRPGQLNLMTSGRGIAHAEDGRAQTSGSINGVQLWVAQSEPTRHLSSSFVHCAELPRVERPNGAVTVLLGEFGSTCSPARVDSPLIGLDIVGDGSFELALDPSFEYAVAMLEGSARFGELRLAPNQFAYLAEGQDGIELIFDGRSRLLLLGGQPFGEEIAMWWNFVARAQSELAEAYEEWQAGNERFGPVNSSLRRANAPRPFWAR
jgi:redox-sensitive bicupin YhaK (pirin superfamily)